MSDNSGCQATPFSVSTTESVSAEQYRISLKAFDASVCEALAVSQAVGVRMASAHIGYATHIFTRICAHATALIRVAPKSRWARSDSDFWDFSAIAGYSRAVIEGYLLLCYTIKTPVSADEWSVRLNVMHLNDCNRRMKILDGVIETAEMSEFLKQANEIKERLKGNSWFSQFDQKLQKRLLSGEFLTVTTRDQQLDELGWDKKEFYMIWNLLSQYTHILPLSFYRLEPNGRGTGLENNFDRSYICMMLNTCANILLDCTNRIVVAFPDTFWARQGIHSRFSPGPKQNWPRSRRRV